MDILSTLVLLAVVAAFAYMAYDAAHKQIKWETKWGQNTDGKLIV